MIPSNLNIDFLFWLMDRDFYLLPEILSSSREYNFVEIKLCGNCKVQNIKTSRQILTTSSRSEQRCEVWRHPDGNRHMRLVNYGHFSSFATFNHSDDEK